MAHCANLYDDQEFPTWDHIPGERQRSPVYHTTGEIVSFDMFMRYRTIIKDDNDEFLVVAFYLDNYDAFNFGKLRKGHTMAITQSTSGWMKRAIIMPPPTECVTSDSFRRQIFPMELEKLQWLSADITKYCKPDDEKWKCHGCVKVQNKEQAPNRCARCKMFCYCDKDCQAKGWKEKDHKTTCKVLADSGFQEMMKLDFSTYNGPLKFSKQ